MPPNDPSGLYGLARPKKSSAKEISASSTLAFTSQLSTLIASSSSASASSTSTARPRKNTTKSDIFATHNRGAQKRARKDLEDDGAFTAQKHKTHSEEVDAATWRRVRRKMEEKARLYGALKRGDVEDEEERFGVDFDRKWAEEQARRGSDAEQEEEESSGADEESEEEVVEFVDEFGRTRRGTRGEKEREERRMRMAEREKLDGDRFTARPAMPENIIVGDTIQSAAFNPDEPIAAQMAELAAKRDRELTPPEEEHFDGSREVRTKGVGFFQFSRDNETRKQEMDALEREREETERRRKEAERRKEERRREVEERRKKIQEKRGKAQADRFLDELMVELQEKKGKTAEG